MGVAWKYLLFLLWLSYLLVSATFLFARGFLLNRTVLNSKSSCEEIERKCNFLTSHDKSDLSNCFQIEGLDNYFFTDRKNQICIKGDVKVLLVVIDALRFDFIAPREVGEKLMPYHNKLTVIADLLESRNARLYKFIADPPTTTMQRINALMTGSLPTFIDVGSNFASSEISEDNLIDQIIHHNKSVVFMGDDTWTRLFPTQFLRSFPYPSFNVWDLDTVDNGVKKHLFPEMKKNDWDLMIAHFLGVDHCGHRYGPIHPEMTRKLIEMNDVIKTIIAEIDNDTILVVIGDHGMTETGDHGGASDNEIGSALFVYSPNKNLMSGLTNSTEVRQIDLTPTLSTLVGIPIPFSNLGTVILDSLPFEGEKISIEKNWKQIMSVLWSNALQMTNYIQEYSKYNMQFAPDALTKLLNNFQSLKIRIEYLENVDEFREIVGETQKYLKSVREMCENVWVQFDSFSMSRGLVLMFLNLTLTFMLVDGMPNKFFLEVVKSNFLVYGFVGLLSVTFITYILFYFGIVSNFELTLYFATNTISIIFFSFVVSFNWDIIADNWYLFSKMKDPLNIISRVITLLACITLFSNSYTIEECSVISFLLTTMIWVSALEMKSECNKKSLGKAIDPTYHTFFSSCRGRILILTIILNILIRLSWYYWQCREEQVRHCYFNKTLSKSSICIVTVLAFAIFVTITRVILRSLGNLVGFSPTIFMSRYSPTICVVCCGCYWVLHSLPTDAKSKLIFPWQLLLLPRIVLFTSLVSILLFYLQPLSVYYISKRMESSRLPIDNLIPALFHHLREVMIQKTGTELKGYPLVYGLATVYSSAFVNISVFLGLFSAILLGEARALVIILLLLSLTILAIILAAVRYGRSNCQGDLFSVPWWAVLCWGLSSIYFFYGTGHQATFPTIQWDSAFLLGDVVATFFPGILVIMNTFISQIIHAILLPIIYIAPFSLSVIWPKLIPLNDGKKGELILFEHDSNLQKGMFLLAVRYLLFHGFRVFVSMFAACIHSRHLMVWKIFAPKFIFESVGLLVTLPFLFLGVVFVERVTKRIQCLIEKIELDNR